MLCSVLQGWKVVSTMEKEVQQAKEGQEYNGECMDLNGVVRVTVSEKVAFKQRRGREFALQIPGGKRKGLEAGTCLAYSRNNKEPVGLKQSRKQDSWRVL